MNYFDLKEKRQYEYQARNQITLWGPQGNVKCFEMFSFY